jgi:hypothetical protein
VGLRRVENILLWNSAAWSNSLRTFLSVTITIEMRRGSAVGIATGYWLGDQEIRVRVPVGSRILRSPYRPGRLGVGTTTPHCKRISL